MGKKYIYAFPKITIKNLFNKKPIRCGRNSKETKSIMLSSGRAALYNAVKILNLKASDTVLVPAYHCGVEIEALIKAGVKIRYYRITRDMAVDKEDLERKTDDGIKALLIIHYWGFPQDLSWLERYSKNKGIALIEDCAHALYSKWENKLLGTFGEVGIYSLSKTLPLPGGGVLRLKQEMVSLNPNRPTKRWYEVKFIIRCILEDMRNQEETRRAMFAELLLTLIEKMRRVEGMENLDYMEKGINIYNEKIGVFTNYLLNCFDPEAIVQRRKENYVILFNNLASIKGIEIPFKSVDKGVCPLFFPIIVRNRDMVEGYLRKNNIEAYVFGRNLHRSLIREDYLESRFLSNHVLGIPIHQDLQKEDMKVIAKAVASSVEIQEKM